MLKTFDVTLLPIKGQRIDRIERTKIDKADSLGHKCPFFPKGKIAGRPEHQRSVSPEGMSVGRRGAAGEIRKVYAAEVG